MKFFVQTFLIFVSVLLLSIQAQAYITKSGNVSGENWTNNNTYYVDGNLIVDDGTTLTIEAGTVVKFAVGQYLRVYGTLIAVGNSSANTYFTSMHDNSVGETILGSTGIPMAGGWAGIEINGINDNDGIVQMNYCVVNYAGTTIYDGAVRLLRPDAGYVSNCDIGHSETNGIYVNLSNISISNNYIHDNGGSGVNAYGDLAPTLTNNNFVNNGFFAAYINCNQLLNHTGNYGSGNVVNAFGLRGEIDTDMTLSASVIGFPVSLINDLSILEGVTVTIPPGEVIKSGHFTITVYGHLIADGEPGNTIVFTSYKDDVYGGDLNGDGTATTPAPGDWEGIQVIGSTNGSIVMDWCILRYGGETNNQALFIGGTDPTTISYSTFEYSAGDGILNSETELTVDHCTFNNNTDHGVYANGGETILTNNQMNNNGGYPAYLFNTSISTYSGNSGSGNGIDAFALRGNVSQDLTLSAADCGFPFVLTGQTYIDEGITLTLTAGDIYKMILGTRIYVYGSLIAKGTPGNEIVFTSIKDDTYGGDLNNDGNATIPEPQDWSGIDVSAATGIFEYCIIRYGGNNGENVNFFQADSAVFNYSVSEYSYNNGVKTAYCNATIENSTISNNGDNGIYSNQGKITINNCVLNNNGEYAAYLSNVDLIEYSGNSGSGNGFDAFNISGNIHQDMTMSSAACGFPFVVKSDINVDAGTTLTIAAGDIIKFDYGGFNVFGTLIAEGSSGNEIIFTSFKDDANGGDLNADGSATTPNKADWDGINLNGNNTAEGIGKFNYTRLLYGGNSEANVYFYRSDTGYFKNSYCGYSYYHGLKADYVNIAIENSSFENNNNYAAYLRYMTIQNYPGNSASGNGVDVFGVKGNVSSDLTWTESVSSVILCLVDDVTIDDNVTLTFNPGTIIKSDYGQFNVYGTFDVNGTESDPVVFTSIEDDSWGGDSNNDADATSPNNGDWSGIYLNGSNANEGIGFFDHCRIRYGGYTGGSADANLYFYHSDTGYFKNSYSEYSYDDGLRADYVDIAIENSSFENNANYAAYMGYMTLRNYPGNSASGNGVDAFGVHGNISSDLTWTQTSSSVILCLLNDVTVDDDITLTLTEGTVIKADYGQFNVYGTLDVNGTESNPVVFTSIEDDSWGGDSNNDADATSPNNGDWNGIYLNGSNANEGIGYFDHCRIRYGGYTGGSADANLYFYHSDTGYFKNSFSEYSYDDGLRADYVDIAIENSSFENNANYAAYMGYITIRNYPGNSTSGNGVDVFGVHGNVSSDITWTETANSVIISLLNDVSVDDNVTLTLTEGTIIKADYGQFNVYGTLDVNGTESNPVVFTSLEDDSWGGDSNNDADATAPAPGNWQGIYLNGNNDNEGTGLFDHCRIRYGGYTAGQADANLYFYHSDTGYFKNSYSEYSYDDGLRADYVDIAIENSSFENNTDYAANMGYMTLRNYPGNSASGNGKDVFGVYGNVSSDLTWTETSSSVILCLTNDVTVDDDVVLTLTEGTIIKADYGQFNVFGTLDVNGTESNPVVFTSLEDDSWGGDSNNDADATVPAPGNWQGIYLNGNNDYEGAGYFDHCRIMYGGYSAGQADANLCFYFSDDGYFKNSICEYSGMTGLRTSYAAPQIRESVFSDNSQYAIYAEGDTVPDLGGNSLTNAGLNVFINNYSGGIQLYNETSHEMNAFYNDWGYYTEAEIDAHIYDDEEYSNYGEVLFNPWYDPANPPLIANFGADTLFGEAPLTVQFTDSTLLNPTGWEWDFENDGNVDATDQHPEWTYFDGGLYSVKLTATSGTTSDSFIRNDYIDVTPNQHLRSYALDFDGTDDYLELTNVVYPESFTLEAWIKPENFIDIQEIIYLFGNNGVQLRLDPDGIIVFGEFNDTTWNYVNSQPGSLYLNQWNHIAVTKNVDQVHLYLNGVNVDNDVFDNDPMVETMHIGGRGSVGDRFFEGYIDEIRIWTTVLTQTELQANMTSYLAGNEPGLMAYYRMNDVMGQMAYDFTGGGSDLQLGSNTGPDTNDPVWTQTNWPYDSYLLADFSADPTIGNGPLTVQFADMSMQNPSTWQWDFENDGTFDAFDQNPLHTYNTLGTYSVKLVVANDTVSDTIVKYNLITVEGTQLMTIAEARQQPMGTVVTVSGIVTCGTEYGNLHFIQDATAGMALYSADLNYFNMGDEVEVTGELYDYNGMMEMGAFTAHSVLSTGNPMPAAQTIAIGDLGEEYESEIVRFDNVTFADGGNQFAAYVNYYFSDVSGSTYTRLHDNTDLKNQVIPNYSVSYVGICAQYDGIPETPYSIYPRDYNDLVYTDITGFERQSTGFSRRYSMINSVCAVDENIVWATAQNEKDYPTLNEITRTTDGGFTWETKQIPGTEGLVISSISAFDDNIAWVSAYQLYGTNQQGIYATADGGTTWTHQSTATFAPEDGGFPNFVHFWDPMNGICMGDPANGYFEIYTTESGGEFWTRVDQGSIPAPLADETGILDRFAVSGDNVWFTTNKGRVFMSPNGGLTWMAQQTPITGACIVEFKNPAEGLLISNGNNEIYRTYDQGNTWQPVTFSGPLRSHDLKYVPGTNGIYVATEISGANAGISYTHDDGETWVAMDYTYGVHFGAMDWINTTTGFIGANNFDENEGGMWKYTGNDLVEYNISWSPQDPTWDDFITITVTGVTQGAWLHWGVNYWQTPDPAYWPPNTEPFPGGGTAVQTPMNGPNGNNELSIVLGPFNDPAQAISQVNFVIHYYDDSWDNNNGNDYHININTGPAQPTVDLKVMLEGPYNSDTKLMRTQLNDQGYLPLSQPYNPSLPYYNESSPVWWYEGTESVASIPNDVVDWVIVQFRDATSPDEATSATIIQEQAAFVLFSGQIVDLDGSSPLTLTETFSNNLYAVVLHRNHLGVISAIPLSETNGNYSFDFTTGAEQAYGGTNGHKLLSDGIWGMVSADGSGNGLIQNTDETAVWKADLGQSGYKGGDFDMNGLVQNTDETNYWKVNLGAGGQTPGKANQTGYQSQVPE